MPGLSQLKKFNSDILSLGNEPELRAKRGEKPVVFPFPKNIKDIDDSDDFVMGMPEAVEQGVSVQKKEEPEDFSDITGSSLAQSSPASSDSEEPSLSGITLPGISFSPSGSQNSSQDSSVPDLSMFMDEPEEEAPAEEEAPKEKQIDELSLDDLLGGAGFDGSEGIAEEEQPVENETENADDFSSPEKNEGADLEDDFGFGNEADSFSNAQGDSFTENPFESSEELPDEIKNALGLTGTKEEKPSEDAFETEPASLKKEPDDFPSTFDEPDFSLDEPVFDDSPIENPSLESPDSFNESPEPHFPDEPIPSESALENPSTEDTFSFDGLSDFFDGPKSDEQDIEPEKNDSVQNADFEPSDFSDIPDISEGGFDTAENQIESAIPEEFEGIPVSEEPSSIKNGSSGENASSFSDDFSMPELGGIDFEENGNPLSDDFSSKAEENTDIPSGLFDSADMEIPEELGEVNKEDPLNEVEKTPDFVSADFSGNDDSAFPAETLDVPDFSTALDENQGDSSVPNEDGEKSEEPQNADAQTESEEEQQATNPFADSFDFGTDVDTIDMSMDKKDDGDFPSNFDFSMDDVPADGEEAQSFEEGPAPEKFDISEMEGLDFQNTAEQPASSNGDFEFSTPDSMSLESGDFDIPGYTGDNILDEKQQNKLREKKEEPNETEAGSLPPNSLSDEQYTKFLKNLSGYPLNVRIALEDLIVKNEFTDDAEFEIIQKVLKKVPARSLAAELEKMLDIPISVPRDFESRTAEEYEAYKESFAYQLRNKIIPGAILTVASVLACVGLFFFTKNCIVKPAVAESLYRQGYELLQSENFPQSEIKFNQARHNKVKKKWFYRYAEGFRAHRQYIRAEQMYKLILAMFKHEKQAGLEYARMELDDLANYERAEEILLREVLDNYINDPDGLLQLGDTYLEWATEKDSSKFQDARSKYSELLQLYGQKNLKRNLLYKGRMMRYFVRTDNLLEVLQLKDNFMPKKRTLDSAGWTEMSGYLLEKLYGNLDPSEEYLRTKIEDVKEMLMRAVKADEKNPVALYNLSKYYVYMNNGELARSALDRTINAFSESERIKRRDMFKFIDSYRLLGEEYVEIREYFKALENYTDGIALYQRERDENGFEANHNIGVLYQDMGDVDYFISGDMESALINYQAAIESKNDIPKIRYKIGYIKYNLQDYADALGSFMKAGEDVPDDINFLLAMGNTLSLRNDNFASQGYYEHLLDELNLIIDRKQIIFPQARASNAEIVDSYMKGMNNLGVTLYRLAKRTGSSMYNAKAMVSFQESLRAWDTLTRNQETMLRLPGGNLAEQNLKYISHPLPEYEPAIYTELPKTLYDEEELR